LINHLADAAPTARESLIALVPQLMLQQDGAMLLDRGWLYNLSALIKAVGKVEGMQSPLLDQVLQWYGDNPEVQSLVLSVRGI